jgi:hypothetical protein
VAFFWKIWRGVFGKISRPMFFSAIVVLPRLGGSNSQPHGRDSALSTAVLILPPPFRKSFILLLGAAACETKIVPGFGQNTTSFLALWGISILEKTPSK